MRVWETIIIHTFIVLTVAMFVLGSSGRSWAVLPVSGVEDSTFSDFDNLMQTIMSDNSISAGALGVMKDGYIVYMRGFGYLDAAETQELPEDALFRIASVTKPMTAAAIRRLIDDGYIGPNDFVFELGQSEGGILNYSAFPTLGDSRLADITVEDLLQHKGGWDRGIAGDLTYMEINIASAMSVSNPPGRENVLRYIMGQPLQYAPGTTYAYSNIGFLILGLIVEQVSGEDYINYVRANVFGDSDAEIEIGRTFPADRNIREPYYDGTFGAYNVFDPAGPLVYWPEGGWHHEARVGQGAVITNTKTLLQYLNNYYIAGTNIGLPRAFDSGNWNHTGSLNGTSSLARQRSSGINYAVVFNKRTSSSPNYSTQMRTEMDDLIINGTVAFPSTLLSPVADFTVSDSSGSEPFTVDFIDFSDGGHIYVTEWSWDFGDSSGASNLQNPSHEYAIPGTYTVSLTVGNANGLDTEIRTDYIVVEGDVYSEALELRDNISQYDDNDDDLLSFAESNLLQWEFDLLDSNGDNSISMSELLVETVGASGQAATVYVDFEHNGIESGTDSEPFNTMREGTAFAGPNADIYLAPHSSAESMVLDTAMTLRHSGGAGAARIGVAMSF